MKSEFEKKLIKLGLSYSNQPDDFYILHRNNDFGRTIKVQLICSAPTNKVIHGSNNGNEIQAIGYFKFRLSTEDKRPDFFILSFQNTSNHCVEYIIISPKELKRRLIEKNRISNNNQEMEMVFWLMPDNYLYETTDIGIEGEWFYMSKGINGRMKDVTDWDYTKFLNDWKRLKMI